MKLNINEPKPNPVNTIPLTIPLCFGKYSHPHIIGAMYENPIPSPKNVGYSSKKVMYEVTNDDTNTPPIAKTPPIENKTYKGIYLSKNGPIGINQAIETVCKTKIILV
jgi:hypothetical protein